MPTELVCPICGERYQCDKGEAHEQPHDVPENAVACPASKGAIHIAVYDNLNKPVKGVKVSCETQQGSKTDGIGYAFYDKLDATKYETRVLLEDSDEDVKSDHYMVTRDTFPATVVAGKITLVQFALVKYAPLKVVLERTDGEKDLPRATFFVESKGHKLDPPSKPHEAGKATFEKLKPTEHYEVRCELDEKDRTSWKLVKDVMPDQTVKASPTTTVVFRVEPRYWIDLAIDDPNDDKATGTFTLTQPELEVSAEGVGQEMKHVQNLRAGTVDVKEVELSRSRELDALH